MKRLGVACFVLVASAAVLIGGRFAAATSTCMKNATANRAACKAQCDDDFQAAAFMCRNIDPACGLPCLAGRQACFDNVQNILAAGMLPDNSVLCSTTDTVTGQTLYGTNGCTAELQGAKTACGAPCPTPTPSTLGGETACQQCVDQAQVAGLECRDACQDAFRSNTTVIAMKKSCHNGFMACVHQCGPAATPTPTP
jgi:hypothetical protein